MKIFLICAAVATFAVIADSGRYETIKSAAIVGGFAVLTYCIIDAVAGVF